MVSNALDAIKSAIDMTAAANRLVMTAQQQADVSGVHVPAIVANWVSHYETGAASSLDRRELPALTVFPKVIHGECAYAQPVKRPFQFVCEELVFSRLRRTNSSRLAIIHEPITGVIHGYHGLFAIQFHLPDCFDRRFPIPQVQGFSDVFAAQPALDRKGAAASPVFPAFCTVFAVFGMSPEEV